MRYPPPVVLMHWWQCGRKTQLATEAIAWLYTGYSNGHYYPCPWGMHWHVGRRYKPEGHRKNEKQHARQAWRRMMLGETPVYDGSPGRGHSDGRLR